MLPSSKLNFAAWTGLGITALFGGTGIYLVGNSKNLGKEENKGVLKEKGHEVSNLVSSSESDSAEADSSPAPPAEESTSQKLVTLPEPASKEEEPSPNLSPESQPLADESAPAEADHSQELDSAPKQGPAETDHSPKESVPAEEDSTLDSTEPKNKEEREDKNSDNTHNPSPDILHLTLDENEELQLPS